ncbi:urea ABC transporter permease subunit UrtC, partial [Pseudomonas syringae]|nr:urea ABC transporter permease subunit UrtC [Pseudomonas syringae]
MNDMTEKPTLRPQASVSGAGKPAGGWLTLIERYSLIWLSLLLLVALPLILG